MQQLHFYTLTWSLWQCATLDAHWLQLCSDCATALSRLCHTCSISTKQRVKCLKRYILQQTHFKWFLGMLPVFECFTSKSNKYLDTPLLSSHWIEPIIITLKLKKVLSIFTVHFQASETWTVLTVWRYSYIICTGYSFQPSTSLKPRHCTIEKK